MIPTLQSSPKMERLRAIADAHYRAGTPEVKRLAFNFFRALDTDGDNLVSLPEFLYLMKLEGHTRLANPHFFRDLDRDGNGFLDFWEVLTLYYIIKSGMPVCECCGVLVLDTYFSCVECFDCPDNSYSLCICCYRSNRSSHNHGGRQQFLDTFTLLETKRRRRSPSSHHFQATGPGEVVYQPHWCNNPHAIVTAVETMIPTLQSSPKMERLRAIADAHYRAGTPEVKRLAFNFFRALDTDGDNLVSLPEFLYLMKLEGHTRLANPHFFRELDRDGNGFLDFWEVLTLYYIIKSGMPVCECCGVLVLETYFSCVECFDCPDSSYSLCIYCYRSNRSSHHNHGGRQQFLDTFTLLETKRRRISSSSHHFQATGPGEVVYQPHWCNNPHAIVPAVETSSLFTWSAALTALEAGLAIGSISSTLCTIL